MKKIGLITLLFILSTASFAQQNRSGQSTNGNTNTNNVVSNGTAPGEDANLDQFGFGPALFVINYDKNVLKDSKDVRVRGDGTLSVNDSGYITALGVEVHYGITLGAKCRTKIAKYELQNCDLSKADNTTGHTISPYLGLYDLENGFGGISAGVVYGYWRADKDLKNRTALNIGLGWTVHKDRLVLANGLREGATPDASLSIEDYTQRKDIEGIVLMISASVGF